MKLKDLLNENLWNERKFGESLPTLEDTTKAHKLKQEQDGKEQNLDDKEKEKARKLGLVWKGKGYGKEKEDGITHKNVDGKLVKVDKGDGPNPTSQDSPLVKKDEPKKLSGKDFDRDLPSDDKPFVGTKVKDGKIYSSGPQRFADDVKDMKGEYDLDGGMKIKDGKMFNADGEEMDSDEIEDFYYQDAFDGNGINVGIDVKEKPKSDEKEKSPTSTFDAPMKPSEINPKDVKKAISHIEKTDPKLADKIQDNLFDLQYFGGWSDLSGKFEEPFTYAGKLTKTGVEAQKAANALLDKIRDFNKKNSDEPKTPGVDPDDNVYTDGEIETIVDKDVDEIKAMLYGKNPLAKYMSYKDDKYIQQHLDALKDVGQISPRQEDFHKDELFAVMSRAQQNMEMGKIKQGERFSGDRKFLPKSKNENYNPGDKYLTESIDLLQREFGEPLPTLQSVMEKHQKNIKEGPDDVKVTKKQLQMLIKQEGDFRKRMLNIEQGFLRDPRPENKKLAKEIKKSYKDNVTKFMREVVGMLKRMK